MTAHRTRLLATVAAVLAFAVTVHVLWAPPLGIVVYGALLGGLSSLLALGLALVHRATRVVNFAQGDLGAAPASFAALLVLSSGASWVLACVAGLAAGAVLGVVVQVVVLRRFARAPRLVVSVATIGLAQLLAGVGLLLPGWFGNGSAAQTFPDPFQARVTIGPVTFHGSDVAVAIVVPLAFAAVALFLRSPLGTSMRACSDDTDRAALAGIPVRRVHAAVWALAGALGFLAVFLRTGVVGPSLGVVLGPTLLLPALAAAVIGGMDRLPTIATAAVAIGVVQQSVQWSWNEPRYVDPVVFVVVLVGLCFTPAGRALRTGDEPSAWRAAREPRPVPRALARRPEYRIARVGVVATAVVLACLVPVAFGESRVDRAAVTAVYGVIALSLVVLTGWAGEVSLGQMALVAIGAAVGGSATARLGLDLGLGLLAAALAGAAAATLIGLPVLRRRGLTIAVVTLAFSLATTSWLLDPRVFGPGRSFDWLPPARVDRPDLFGLLDVRSETRFYFVCLAVLAGAAVAVVRFRTGRRGRVLVAVRENARGASVYGIDPRRTTLGAFAVSGALAGLAGGLFVHQQNALQLGSFDAGESLVVFAMVVVGGMASVPGALLGALFVRGVTWWLPAEWQFVTTGVALLVVLEVFRGGLGAAFADLRDAWLRRLARRRGIPAPSLLGLTPDPPAPAREPDDESGGTGPARGTGAPVLSVRGLRAGYEGTPVLFGVDLDVGEGEIVALLGTNGSGKSTLLHAVTGLVAANAGTVRYDGRDVTGRRPEWLATHGIALAPGGHGVFPSLTVAENLRLATRAARAAGGPPGRVDGLARFPALADRLGTRAGDLSGGEQQMLTLAMAVSARPRLLLVDELSHGLSPAAVSAVRDLLDSLRRAGTTIVVVEQSLDRALALADRAYWLERGAIRFSGTAAELRERPDLARPVFLRVEDRTAPPRREPAETAPRLALGGLTKHYGGIVAIEDVSFTVADAEIVGILGPNGAGKTTLLDVVSGFVPADRGTVTLRTATGTHALTRLRPDARARLGLGRSFQDGRLFPALTVRETIAVACEHRPHLPAHAGSRERATRDRVDALVERLRLGDVADRFVHELSTGTRRIVDLACVLAHEPPVVLLDEPSSGMAQREAEALVPLLLDVRDTLATSLVVVEHDVGLLAVLADRLLALDLGRVVADGPPGDVLAHPAARSTYLGSLRQGPA